jgi:aldehyde dehydrogenase (NAD+)
MIASIIGVHPEYFNYFAELETAGKCLEWGRDHLALDEINIYLQDKDAKTPETVKMILYDYMMQAIKQVPAGSNGVIFTPWLHGNRCPFEDPNARGMFFNISIETGKTELIHAVDQIFFTGSVRVGKIVMAAAAEHLTPVILELGGKSPCLVDQTADLEKTAQRIIWGKALNAGQTCVAPDYILVDRRVQQQLIVALKKAIAKFFGEQMLESGDYGKIINQKAYDRLRGLLEDERPRIISGGACDPEQLKIELTLLDNPALDSPVMTEEIFGPLLPIIAYADLSEAIAIIRSREKPLALYLFTKGKNIATWVVNNLHYGGGCINDTIMHVANYHLPFGGVGASGMGSYHGKKGFETFSHAKSILKQTFAFEVPLRYAPYKNKLKLIKRIMG